MTVRLVVTKSPTELAAIVDARDHAMRAVVTRCAEGHVVPVQDWGVDANETRAAPAVITCNTDNGHRRVTVEF